MADDVFARVPIWLITTLPTLGFLLVVHYLFPSSNLSLHELVFPNDFERYAFRACVLLYVAPMAVSLITYHTVNLPFTTSLLTLILLHLRFLLVVGEILGLCQYFGITFIESPTLHELGISLFINCIIPVMLLTIFLVYKNVKTPFRRASLITKSIICLLCILVKVHDSIPCDKGVLCNYKEIYFLPLYLAFKLTEAFDIGGRAFVIRYDSNEFLYNKAETRRKLLQQKCEDADSEDNV